MKLHRIATIWGILFTGWCCYYVTVNLPIGLFGLIAGLFCLGAGIYGIKVQGW